MPRRPAAPISTADVLDTVRDWIEADPRPAAAIAEAAGMSKAQLWEITSGHTREIQLGTLLRLCRALGKTLADLSRER